MVQHKGLSFKRIGHASVRIETEDGRVIYIDPWSEVMGDDEPGDADFVFITHDDFDHYDPEGIARVSKGDTQVVAYDAIDTSNLDLPVTELAYNGELTVDGIEVRAVPAHNRADGDHVDDSGEPFHAKEEVVGLLLTVDGTTVYFASDTDFLDEHKEITADIFIPPIGGHYTMDRREAAEFSESVDPDLVLPVHYDTFEAIETDAKAFKRDVEKKGSEVELF
ncbi:MAG: MBL fold metallo-hydrolase [Halobacteria archaeon]|nr:MBL fold metallo-hydrolase [Halobacteria archaeon]